MSSIPPASGQREPHLRPVTSVPEPERRAGPRFGLSRRPPARDPDGGLGSSREEIAERLRSGFDIEDAGEILDAILGPEE